MPAMITRNSVRASRATARTAQMLKAKKSAEAAGATERRAAFNEKAASVPLWNLVLQRPDGRYTTVLVWAASAAAAAEVAPHKIATMNSGATCPNWFVKDRTDRGEDDLAPYDGPFTITSSVQVCPYCLRKEAKHLQACCCPRGFTLPVPTV